MNSTDISGLKLISNKQDLVKTFCKTYESVIAQHFAYNEQLISEAKEILNSIKNEKAYKINRRSYKLAFLLSFGVQDSCLSALKFYESLMDCTKIIKTFSRSIQTKLCCLESESLPTVIGICHVIDEIIELFRIRSNFGSREIRVSVFDKRQKWRRLCACIVDTANFYFKNIELKLDFVDDFMDWTSDKFTNRIKEADLVIIARVVTDYTSFSINLVLQVIQREMKENSILIHFDSKSKRYNSMLGRLISTTNSLSVIKSSQISNLSFEDLRNEQYSLDLPINWQTHFQPAIFSTWMKYSEINNDSLEKKVPQITLDSENQSDMQSKQTTNVTKEAEPSIKHRNLHDAVNALIDILKEKNTSDKQIASKKQVKSSTTKKKGKPSIQSKNVNVTSDAAHSQILLQKSTKMANSKLSDASTVKNIKPNRENPDSHSKKVEDKISTVSETKASGSKKKIKVKSSEKSDKNMLASEKTTSKGNSETRPTNKNIPIPTTRNTKNVSPVKLTKKSTKTLPTEKIKLTGKFARMDLEKKNKDERHRMKAKQASFAKHANFDYDD